MRSYRLFYTRCTDNNIEILRVRESHQGDNPYEYPIKFTLRSKKTGIETRAGTNMDELLKSWGY
jgi:hypothetical protein